MTADLDPMRSLLMVLGVGGSVGSVVVGLVMLAAYWLLTPDAAVLLGRIAEIDPIRSPAGTEAQIMHSTAALCAHMAAIALAAALWAAGGPPGVTWMDLLIGIVIGWVSAGIVGWWGLRWYLRDPERQRIAYESVRSEPFGDVPGPRNGVQS